MKVIFAVAVAILLLSVGCQKPTEQPPALDEKIAKERRDALARAANTVQQFDKVRVFYVLLVDGEIFDASPQDRPLEFIIGARQVVPGFEEAILGMKLGEEKTFVVPAAKGYGGTDEKLVKEYPITMFEAQNIQLEIGKEVEVAEMLPKKGKVVDINATSQKVKVDFNHPLANKTLQFKVKVVDIIKPVMTPIEQPPERIEVPLGDQNKSG